MATTLENLPRWKTANIYSSLEGNDYTAALAELEQRIDSLTAWFDETGVRRLSAPATESSPKLAESIARALDELNAIALRYGRLDSFIHAFVTTNSYDAVAAREASRLELLGTKRQKLEVRFKAGSAVSRPS